MDKIFQWKNLPCWVLVNFSLSEGKMSANRTKLGTTFLLQNTGRSPSPILNEGDTQRSINTTEL